MNSITRTSSAPDARRSARAGARTSTAAGPRSRAPRAGCGSNVTTHERQARGARRVDDGAVAAVDAVERADRDRPLGRRKLVRVPGDAVTAARSRAAPARRRAGPTATSRPSWTSRTGPVPGPLDRPAASQRADVLGVRRARASGRNGSASTRREHGLLVGIVDARTARRAVRRNVTQCPPSASAIALTYVPLPTCSSSSMSGPVSTQRGRLVHRAATGRASRPRCRAGAAGRRARRRSSPPTPPGRAARPRRETARAPHRGRRARRSPRRTSPSASPVVVRTAEPDLGHVALVEPDEVPGESGRPPEQHEQQPARRGVERTRVPGLDAIPAAERARRSRRTTARPACRPARGRPRSGRVTPSPACGDVLPADELDDLVDRLARSRTRPPACGRRRRSSGRSPTRPDPRPVERRLTRRVGPFCVGGSRIRATMSAPRPHGDGR